MGFPDTRLTLIQRLASNGREEDWARFMKDYWGPVCRLAMRWGAPELHDAEDVASQTFEALLRNRLLVRWASNRSAKLRTLLCRVVRNILSNRHRAKVNWDRLVRELAEITEAEESDRTGEEQIKAFYAAWAEDAVGRAVESLAAEYYHQGKGDYIRVLYGRLCQDLTIAEVAEALETPPATVDHWYRHVKQALAQKLEQVVRRHAYRYCSGEEAEEEFTLEWNRLGQYMADCGGLEESVRKAYELIDPVATTRRGDTSLTRAVTRLTSIIRSTKDVSESRDTT